MRTKDLGLFLLVAATLYLGGVYGSKQRTPVHSNMDTTQYITLPLDSMCLDSLWFEIVTDGDTASFYLRVQDN